MLSQHDIMATPAAALPLIAAWVHQWRICSHIESDVLSKNVQKQYHAVRQWLSLGTRHLA
jgi:hypothetical protein